MTDAVQNQTIHRRRLLGSATALLGTTLASVGPLQGLAARAAVAQEGGPPGTAGRGAGGYGPLRPAGPEPALPEGFMYMMLGVEGSPMSDGKPTRRAHDGMGALPLANGGIRLIRNHEDRASSQSATLIGDAAAAYDPRGGGGTTSLEVHVTSSGERRLVRSFVSLGGTIVNCAGGPTPWATG